MVSQLRLMTRTAPPCRETRVRQAAAACCSERPTGPQEQHVHARQRSSSKGKGSKNERRYPHNVKLSSRERGGEEGRVVGNKRSSVSDHPL